MKVRAAVAALALMLASCGSTAEEAATTTTEASPITTQAPTTTTTEAPTTRTEEPTTTEAPSTTIVLTHYQLMELAYGERVDEMCGLFLSQGYDDQLNGMITLLEPLAEAAPETFIQPDDVGILDATLAWMWFDEKCA